MKIAAVVGAALSAAVVAGGVLAGTAVAQEVTDPAPQVKAAICGNPTVDTIDDAAQIAVADGKAKKAAAEKAKEDADKDVLDAEAAAIDPDGDSGATKSAAELAAIEVAKKDAETAAENLRVAKVRLAGFKADLDVALAVQEQTRTFIGARDYAAVKTDLCGTPTATPTAGPSPTATPVPDPTVAYADCAAARAANVAPIALDQPGYRAALDSDRDGLACELVEDTAAPKLPTAIDTGRPA